MPDASPTVLLNSMAKAEKDLAMYTAIIGHRPKLTAAQRDSKIEKPIPATQPGRISLWMHHVSHQARRRINEARLRLAS